MSNAALGRPYRAVFISDLHLGSFRCDVRSLSDFLDGCRAETIFLVGDVFDFWSLAAGAVWTAKHTEVMHKLFRTMLGGSRVVIIPGNHDDGFARFLDLRFHRLEIRREWLHQTVNGERFLVVHGHEQDELLERASGIARAASALRERVGALAGPLMRTGRRSRRRQTFPARMWQRVQRSVAGVDEIEVKLAAEARRREFDGVICGHTHFAADRVIDGVRYMNCGDWVRNCTAIAETWSGELQLLQWQAPQARKTRHGEEHRGIWGWNGATIENGVAKEMR